MPTQSLTPEKRDPDPRLEAAREPSRPAPGRAIPPEALRRAIDRPSSSSPSTVLQLQRLYGNRAVRGLISASLPQSLPSGPESGSAVVQRQLAVTAAQHESEREADRFADQVSRHLSAPRTLASGGNDLSAPGSMSAGGPLQAPLAVMRAPQAAPPSGLGGGPVPAQVESGIRQARGGGQALPHGFRSRVEGAFGADFRHVRVHTDDRAHQLNEDTGARAFTTGHDIFFRHGEFQPDSSSGQRLLAHELTHVLQQGARSGGSISAAPMPVIQRDLISYDDFVSASKSEKFGKEGKAYTAIKNSLARYHEIKNEDSDVDTLQVLRLLSDQCDQWLLKHTQLEVSEKGTVEYKANEKKSVDRIDAIVNLKFQADEEFARLAATSAVPAKAAERPMINVYTGQGAVANLAEFSFGSSGFWSCSPIVMFNSRTKMAGLYHFASGSLGDQQRELLNMAASVQPTDIEIIRGKFAPEIDMERFINDDPYAQPEAVNQALDEMGYSGDEKFELKKDKKKLKEAFWQRGDLGLLTRFFEFCRKKFKTQVTTWEESTEGLVVYMDANGRLQISFQTMLSKNQNDNLLDLQKFKGHELDELSPKIKAFTSGIVNYEFGAFKD